MPSGKEVGGGGGGGGGVGEVREQRYYFHTLHKLFYIGHRFTDILKRS